LEGTHCSSKTFHVIEHVRLAPPLEIAGSPPGGCAPSVKNHCIREYGTKHSVLGHEEFKTNVCCILKQISAKLRLKIINVLYIF